MKKISEKSLNEFKKLAFQIGFEDGIRAYKIAKEWKKKKPKKKGKKRSKKI